MKALSTSVLALVIAAAPIVCSPASSDKTLQTKDGTVTYGSSQNPTTKLAKNASATLNDNDYAQTGGGHSLATVTMPDGSVVTMGSNSDVQMKNFDIVGGTNTANFVVVGKVRFDVHHPSGAKANYTFQTPTGQIAVRGTIGDILATTGSNGAPGGLQVNVYELTNPALPVQVTLVNGQVFTLAAGQSLVVTSAAGALVGSVGAVSNTTFAPFTQLGAPVNAGSLGISGTTAAGAAAGSAAATTAAAAVGAAAAVTATTQHTTPSNPPPTMTPSPMPTGTTVPITISGHPASAPSSGTAPAPPAAGPVFPGVRPTLPERPTIPHPYGRPSPPVN